MSSNQKSLKDSLKAWWADDAHWFPRMVKDIQFGRVGLYDLRHDDQRDVYTLDYVHVKKSELPPEAVHVTGRNWSDYFVDHVKAGTAPDGRQGTAVNLYLYFQNNSINDALLWTPKKELPIDSKMLALILVAVGVVALVFLGKVL